MHQAQNIEAIGSLAAGVAHELNNVLSVARAERLLVVRPEMKVFYISGYTYDARGAPWQLLLHRRVHPEADHSTGLGRKVRAALDSELRTSLSPNAN